MIRFVPLLLIAALLVASPTHGATQRVIKVLPHFLDREGRHTLSPSLFERDAYQARLRDHPDEQSGLRYDVQWQSTQPGEFVLKLELLGRVEKGVIRRHAIETKVVARRPNSRWQALMFTGDAFKQFGPVVAWRVSLWREDTMLAHEQSFLWE